MEAIVKKKDNIKSLAVRPELHNLKILFGMYCFLIFTDYIMPQYFGVHLGYDLTCTRLINIIFIIYMLCNRYVLNHFLKSSLDCSVCVPLLSYLFVAVYTMVLRVDPNAFFMVFFEIFTFFMLVYGIRYVVGYRRTIKYSVVCAYVLSILGFVEYAYGESLFLKFLRTVPTGVSNTYRSGQYRIMGPCGHPLGYGLLLLLLIGIASTDEEKDEVYLFKRPLLIILLYGNVFLTGSRSTLGISLLEMFLILVCSKKNNVKKSLLWLGGVIISLILFIFLFHNTSLGRYVLLQFASVCDQLFDTNYAVQFGAEIDRLNLSEDYRDKLPKIFTLDWLNPFLGRGVKRGFSAVIDGVSIMSTDNYYVTQFIKYAYPGLVTYVIFMISMFAAMIRGIAKYKSGICKMMLVASVCYFINLWWLDALQTLKYEYIIAAIFFAYIAARKDEKKMI